MRSCLAGPSTAPLKQSAVVQQQHNSITEVSKWMIITVVIQKMIQGYITQKFFIRTSLDMKIIDRNTYTPVMRMTDLMNQMQPIVQQAHQVLQVQQVQPDTSTSTNINTNMARPQPQRIQENTQMIQVPVPATVPAPPLNRRLPEIITCLLPTHHPSHTQIPVTCHPLSTQNKSMLSPHTNSRLAVPPDSTKGRKKQRNSRPKSTTRKNNTENKKTEKEKNTKIRAGRNRQKEEELSIEDKLSTT